MGLIEALGIKRGEAVFLAGAGGKTSMLRQLAYEAKTRGWPVVLGTTAKVAAGEFGDFTTVWLGSDVAETAGRVRSVWKRGEVPFVAGGFLEDRGKYSGADTAVLEQLYRQLEESSFFVEADGSRNLPCKVPREKEPVLAEFAGLVVFVLGSDAISMPLDERYCYNVKGAKAILGKYLEYDPEKTILSPEVLSHLILSEEGGRKGVFSGQRFCVFINKVESYPRRLDAFCLREILEKNGVPAVVGSLNLQMIYREKIPAVAVLILAGGKSRRMGRPKQLLPCSGGNFLEVSVNLYRPFGQVVVVLGYEAEKIRAQSNLRDCRVVVNEKYEEGMSTSLKAGYNEVRDEGLDGILVAFCDMPHLKPRTVERILAGAAEKPGRIVIPAYRGEGGHPVYIPRRFFPFIEAVSGDEGARSILRNNPDEIYRVAVDDYAVTGDIDSKQMYRFISKKEGW